MVDALGIRLHDRPWEITGNQPHLRIFGVLPDDGDFFDARLTVRHRIDDEPYVGELFGYTSGQPTGVPRVVHRNRDVLGRQFAVNVLIDAGGKRWRRDGGTHGLPPDADGHCDEKDEGQQG